MRKTLPLLATHVVKQAEESAFYKPAVKIDSSIPAAERKRLWAAYRSTISETVVPGYRRLHDFIRDEYLPRCREDVGLGALPGGREWYAHLVRIRTGTALTPEQIHELGQREVDRIDEEMKRVRARPAPPGAARGFSSADDLLDTYRSLRKRVHKRVPRLFHDFPAADYEIRAVEPFRQRTAAGASYMAASPDGSRPGIFYVNTRGWQRRGRPGTEALFLHEAVPGHHFQIAIQQELTGLPRFRRFGRFTAFVEGWGLYAETLGPTLGLYRDRDQLLGALASERFRARRLVVDTGIHALGWSRDRALSYLGSEAEVDRYTVLPAQALAYKIGQLKFSELRARAEAALGEGFDVRDFHARVLRSGALPLDVLEADVDSWIEEELPLHVEEAPGGT
jgi:uncharacterized protein (DUF885 family)